MANNILDRRSDGNVASAVNDGGDRRRTEVANGNLSISMSYYVLSTSKAMPSLVAAL